MSTPTTNVVALPTLSPLGKPTVKSVIHTGSFGHFEFIEMDGKKYRAIAMDLCIWGVEFTFAKGRSALVREKQGYPAVTLTSMFDAQRVADFLNSFPHRPSASDYRPVKLDQFSRRKGD